MPKEAVDVAVALVLVVVVGTYVGISCDGVGVKNDNISSDPATLTTRLPMRKKMGSVCILKVMTVPKEEGGRRKGSENC